MLRTAGDPRGTPPMGRRSAALHRPLPRQLGHWGFRRLEGLDLLAGVARGGFRRLESPACARAGGSAAVESVQRIEPAFSQCAVYLGPGGARVPRVRSRLRAYRGSWLRGPVGGAALRAARRLSGRRRGQARNSRAAVSRFSRPAFGAGDRTRRGFSPLRRRRRPAAADSRPIRRARPIFPLDAAYRLGLAELARGVSRPEWRGGAAFRSRTFGAG